MEDDVMNHEFQVRVDALERIDTALDQVHAVCADYTAEFTDEPDGSLREAVETVHVVEAAVRQLLRPMIWSRTTLLDQSSCVDCLALHPGDDLVIVDNEHLCEACVIAELLRLRREQGE